MKLSKKMYPFLAGEKLESTHYFKFRKAGTLMSREDFLYKKFWDKSTSVVHIGACDHLDLIDTKIREGRWTHSRLMDCTDRVVGFDINQEAVKFCNDLGYDNIFYADVTVDSDFVISKIRGYDCFFLGEVLEHIDNPVDFLKSLNDNYHQYVPKIVITVPNAFDFGHFKNSFWGVEAINTDHRYWFTPYTLCKVCVQSGIQPNEMYLANCNFGRKRKLINWIFPDNMFYGDIILVGDLSKK